MTVLSSVSCCNNNLSFLNNIHGSVWWSVFLKCTDAVKLEKNSFCLYKIALSTTALSNANHSFCPHNGCHFLAYNYSINPSCNTVYEMIRLKKVIKISQINVPPPIPKKSYSDTICFSYVYAIYVHRKNPRIYLFLFI